MSIKILTKQGEEITHIDDARAYNFDAGNKSGIVKGALNEGRLFAAASNVIAIETCELRIAGHRVVIDSAESISLTNIPQTATRYSLIAEILVSPLSVPSFRLFVQNANNEVIQQNLYKTLTGDGIYQLKIGNFTLGTNGNITDIVRTADIISGGANNGVGDIEFNATVETISSDLQPEVNVDYNEETRKYDMHFALPKGSGTNVKVGSVTQTEISFDSNPQEQLNAKANEQQLNRKADKVVGATENNLVSLDSEGNIKDSGTTAFKLANRYVKATMSADFIVPAVSAWSAFNIPFNNIEQSIPNRFTLSNGTLTYNGDETIVIEIQFNLRYATTQGTRPSVIQGFMRKNNSTLFGTEVNGGSFYAWSLTASNIITLTKGNTINLVAQFESATSADSRKFLKDSTNILIKEISVV